MLDNERRQPSASRDAPGFRSVVQAELSLLLSDPLFDRSPMLSRLLSYLVEETLAGRGDRLKSYSVAVEGLGRAPDFDATADSYPRVQISRLRKQLAAYYARHHLAGQKCLYLQPGSYHVRVAGLATAYPDLYHPMFDTSRQAPQGDLEAGNALGDRNVALTKVDLISANWRPWIFGAMIVIATVVTFVLTW